MYAATVYLRWSTRLRGSFDVGCGVVEVVVDVDDIPGLGINGRTFVPNTSGTSLSIGVRLGLSVRLRHVCCIEGAWRLWRETCVSASISSPSTGFRTKFNELAYSSLMLL
jgi:hypothetical protein